MSKQYKVIGFIIVFFHLVGAVGTIFGETRDLMLLLTPFNLLLSTGFLCYGHQGSLVKLSGFFIIAFLIGFLVEVLGVHTGFPFGNYWYGPTLGWKLFDVPLIIGLNWFLLSYTFGMLLQSFRLPTFAHILLAALGMTLLDLLMEPVAISLHYWSWAGPVPLSNYLGWFVVSSIIQIFFVNFEFKQTNPLVIPLILAQIGYFFLIFIFR